MGAIPKEKKMTTMTNKESALDLRAHFGFSVVPFTREIPIKDRWHSEIFDQPLTALRQTIEQRMSGVVLAPSGTGKTVILRTLRAQLPEQPRPPALLGRARLADVVLPVVLQREPRSRGGASA